MKTYKMGLRAKIILAIVVGTMLIGSVLVGITFFYLNRVLSDSLIQQGYLVGNSLAEATAEKIIEKDVIACRQITEKYREYPNIEYILIEDPDNNVITDTFNGQIPDQLKQTTLSEEDFSEKKYVIQKVVLDSPQGSREIYEVGIPIEEGLIGFIRLGMKKEFIDTIIRNTLLTIGLTIIGGMVIAIVLSLIIITVQVTRPVLHLTHAAEKISLGEFDFPIEVTAKNELQDLGVALDRMRDSLRTCIERLRMGRKK